MALCFMRISIRIKEQITYQFNVGKYFCLFHNNENQNLMDLYLIQFCPSTITTYYHIWRFGKIPFSSFLWVETLEIYTVWSNGRNLKFFSGSHNGILLQKLSWPTVRKNCDREKLLKFEAEGWDFAKILRSLEQFIQTMKGQNNFW